MEKTKQKSSKIFTAEDAGENSKTFLTGLHDNILFFII